MVKGASPIMGYSSFKQRIKDNEVIFDEDSLQLTYSSNKNHDLKYLGDYKVNDNIMDLNYSRMDSPYAYIQREAMTMEISFNGETLFLDFYNMERREE